MSLVFLVGAPGFAQYLSIIHDIVVEPKTDESFKDSIIDLCYYRILPTEEACTIRAGGSLSSPESPIVECQTVPFHDGCLEARHSTKRSPYMTNQTNEEQQAIKNYGVASSNNDKDH